MQTPPFARIAVAKAVAKSLVQRHQYHGYTVAPECLPFFLHFESLCTPCDLPWRHVVSSVCRIYTEGYTHDEIVLFHPLVSTLHPASPREHTRRARRTFFSPALFAPRLLIDGPPRTARQYRNCGVFVIVTSLHSHLLANRLSRNFDESSSFEDVSPVFVRRS